MSYENIRLVKPNFAVVGSYFYSLNEDTNTLLCKIDDGATAFEYPTNVPIGTQVKSLQYDGYYFWSLQDHPSGGILIKKWLIDNYLCKQSTSFEYINDDNYTYLSNTFGLEHYLTTISDIDTAARTNSLSISEYSDNLVTPGTLLFLGPNKSNEREVVNVTDVTEDVITLDARTSHIYAIGDQVSVCPSFFVFNHYDGTDASKGTLIRFDALTGSYLSSDTSVEYQNVDAATFYRFYGILPDYPDAPSLVYVKDTNARLRNMSDLIDIIDATTLSDDFTGTDNSLPTSDLWNIVRGDPELINNSLYLSTAADGHDTIATAYNLLADFSVEVSGTMGGFTTYTGTTNRLHHYIGLNIPNKASYEFGMAYLDNYTSTIFYEDFTASGIGWEGTADYTSGYLNQTTDGAEAQTIDTFDIGPGWEITLKLKHHGQGSSDDIYYVSPIYVDGDNRLSLYMRTYSSSDNFLRFYKRINGSEVIFTTSYKYNFYNDAGSWFYVTMKRDLNDTLYFKVWREDETEPTSWDWQGSGAASNIPQQGKVHSRAALTEPPGTGLDDIWIRDITLYSKEAMSGDTNTYVSIDGTIVTYDLIASGTQTASDGYRLGIDRADDLISFKYKTTLSGIDTSDWTTLYSLSAYTNDCNINLGLQTKSTTASGAIFDDYIYHYGTARYPVENVPYYGIMNMDNIRADQSTNIDVHDLAINEGTMYRLQDEATYYGTDNSWSTYNYQTSPIRPFIDFITVSVDPVILPANGKNVSVVTAVVQDQYGQGADNRPITFTDTDEYGYITVPEVFTSANGRAETVYKAGLDVAAVTIKGSVTQYN